MMVIGTDLAKLLQWRIKQLWEIRHEWGESFLIKCKTHCQQTNTSNFV